MGKKERLLSLDVMRGITIAGMILVNNPGSWEYIYAPLRHAEWHRLTPTDLVFPFFMFIMGVSTYFSLRKYDFAANSTTITKILRRTIVILLIGWALDWLSRAWGGFKNPDKTFFEAINTLDNLRILGVFPRLALCYCATALLAVLTGKNRLRIMAWTAAVILVGYCAVLLVGHGLDFSEENVIGIIDRAVLGVKHMYRDTIDGVTLSFDPEGILSTLPSIAHCIIGFVCGSLIVGSKDKTEASYRLFIVGAILTICGLLLDYGMPINKKIWSPTFVLTTCGLASTVLALLIWIIDIRGHKEWCTFFRAFGVNPLFLYVLSAVLATALWRIDIVVNAAEGIKLSLSWLVYDNYLLSLCQDNATLASLLYALLFVLLNWVIGYVLYKKKIYIKI